MTYNKKDNSNNLSDAAHTLRSKDASQDEKHEAAVKLGREGGHHGHGGNRQDK